jgi:hypothetical protein
LGILRPLPHILLIPKPPPNGSGSKSGDAIIASRLRSLVSIPLNLPHQLRLGDSHLTFLIALTNYEESIYQQVQLSSIEQVSRVEGLTFDRIQGIFKHQYAQKKTKDGAVSNVSALMKSVTAKDTKTSPQLSGTLRLGS